MCIVRHVTYACTVYSGTSKFWGQLFCPSCVLDFSFGSWKYNIMKLSIWCLVKVFSSLSVLYLG